MKTLLENPNYIAYAVGIIGTILAVYIAYLWVRPDRAPCDYCRRWKRASGKT